MWETHRFNYLALNFFLVYHKINQSTLRAFIYITGSRMFQSRSWEAEAWFTVCLVNHRRLDQSQENHFLSIQELPHATSQEMPGY
jgi:hypothetical protein